MTLTTLRKSIQYTAARHVLRRRQLVARAHTGARFAFRTADAVGRYLYKRGTYEPELSEFLMNWQPTRPDALFVDVGANIGYYTVHTALRGIPVIAFEPDPLNYRLLTSNIERNGCQGVEALQCALSDTQGTAAFYRYPEKNLGRHSLLAINNVEPIEISTVRFDAFLQQRGIAPDRVELIKIDVEGYEPCVLRGMEQMLREVGPIIVAEFSPALMHRGGLSATQFVNFMIEAGYTASTLSANAVTPLAMEQLTDAPPEDGTNLIWKKVVA